ncbi:hypothetical protein OIU77_002248 [Salix suchowensis]|uniref:Ubiquitin-like domain-containing protein n=1 Tax=Salix suchowensis TaxID=1278906 RepID=A0ABQ9B442_9ROSI|nr:hypothetical protein OIU77_002248 [Salix suchowensis]
MAVQVSPSKFIEREIEAQQKLPQDQLIMVLDNNQSHLIIYQDGEGTSLVDCGIQDGSPLHFLRPTSHSLRIMCSLGLILVVVIAFFSKFLVEKEV